MRKSNGGFLNKIAPIRKVLRKSASRQDLKILGDKVTLEKVLGLTTTNTNGLACNPVTGVLAYPAGCVIVLYDQKAKLQTHISNPDKKTITCLDFSRDGKYLVSGESGQQPSVRVWELGENIIQVAELRGHKSGISCVEFSPNEKLLVSIGDQHDMLVNVWNWKLGHTVGCNKSGCRVRAVSFSEDGSYLVTVGKRHVKFWYLDSEASSKGNLSTTPITGRSGILGDQRNNYFTDVVCGKGKSSKFTYCVTKSGLLCMFSQKRLLDKWVELKSGSTSCLLVTNEFIVCGCSDGIVRVFEPITLRFIATFPKPHNLGVNVSDGITASDLVTPGDGKNSPDLVALAVDEQQWKLTCIYNDHSLYIWDIHDIRKVGKVASFLFHSACIWGIEMYPYFEEAGSQRLPYGSFLTCSSDDTIRLWNLENGTSSIKAYPRNLYSKELLKVVYIDEGLTNLQDTSMAPFGKESDSKNGVRCMQVSPNGQVIATGDRNGNLRIYDMQFFDELMRIEAHESEILCVEFSSTESGYNLLASSSRDRLIHIFDVNKDYTLLQTIDDHSSSITAVCFNYDLGVLQLLSCGADKVVMFHTAVMGDGGSINFVRNTIVPGKSTLYDMGVEPTRKFAATVGQDRNLRVYDIQGAKQVNTYKGSLSDEGNLIKLQLDASGVYAAISCSDKTIGIYDFENGECEASMFGHSELVTGLKFTSDGKRLISVSGDGCIFVWTLPSTFTENILNRMHDLNLPIPRNHDIKQDGISELRRKTFVVPDGSPQSNQLEEFADAIQVIENVPGKSAFGYRFSVSQLPSWAQKQIGVGDSGAGNKGLSQPLGRWGERADVQLGTVQEVGPDGRNYLNSQDSTMSSEKSSMSEDQMPTQADVIYPPSGEDILITDAERTFQVTETKRHNLSTPSKHSNDRDVKADLETNGVTNDDIESDLESESLPEERGDSTESDDEEAFSPLVDHYEKLATPPSSEKPRSNSVSSETSAPISLGGHRASISAKFLSRSQRASRSSASTVTAEEQRRRIEALKARINSNSASSSLPSTSNSTNNIKNTTQPKRTITMRRQTSIDAPSQSRDQTKDTISSNLKRTQLLSKSCQNLTFADNIDQELHKLRGSSFNNEIPLSPSQLSTQDRMLYDPRRSSTPLDKNFSRRDYDKNNRRSNVNAWNRAPIVSPVGPPSGNDSPTKSNLHLKTTSSSKGGMCSPSRSRKAIDVDRKSVSDVVLRRSGGKKRNRPKSMVIVSEAQKEKTTPQQFRFDEPFQSHSDTESETNGNLFTSSPTNHYDKTKSLTDSTSRLSPLQSSNRVVIRDIDIDEKISSTSNATFTTETEIERVSRVAAEIESNVKTLTLQALKNDHDSTYDDHGEHDIEAGTSKRLILLYEAGLVSTNGNIVQGSPPERDIQETPNDVCPKEEPVSKDTLHSTTNGSVTWDDCQSVMRNLLQSYSDATELQTKILQQPPDDNQKQLLSLISRTYSAIENNIHEERKKLDDIVKLSNSSHLESDCFKELQKTLALTTSSQSGSGVEMLSLLDKYSNVLVDMISSKMKSKETMI